MANPEHLHLLTDWVDGVIERWNQWRRDNPTVVPDLSGEKLIESDWSGVNLSGANLSGADLGWTNLRDANLRAVNLSGAEVIRADLTGADLSGADLGSTDFSWTDLAGANLSQAYLFTTNLNSANLTGADLSGAQLGGTIFADTNLSDARGLGTCRHEAPSSVGIDTVFQSSGTIPESFLRGCGVPEQFIIFARSLAGQVVDYYSCFISYSSYDRAFAERLHADLRAKSLRCWFAPEDLRIGDRFQERIEESIRLFDKVMIVLSNASVQSNWVEREVNAAREREDREKRTVLFPIRIDDAVMNAPQAWAADIRRSRHIGNFREWGAQASYAKALDRLLRDLKTDNGSLMGGN
jgi:uncharacterized protein YjbI with pentapeptide repeats